MQNIIYRVIITGLAILQALTTTAGAADIDAVMALPMPNGYRLQAGLLERIEDGVATVEIMRDNGDLEYYDYFCDEYADITPGDAVIVMLYDCGTQEWHDDAIMIVVEY